jgi:DASS family divalent anion:Na+ symporter
MSDRRTRQRTLALRTAVVIAGLTLWLMPSPEGLTIQAWRVFVVFAAAIVSVVLNAFPILTASVFAVSIVVLSGLLPPSKAYAGFANGTILLIVVAFLVARAVVKCGLGTRIGYLVVTWFGRSTLGLSYSIFLIDGLIAPAFPSNTARSGVIFPIAFSLAKAVGATPEPPQNPRLGTFLMFSGICSLSLSSTLWLTAMAANPLGAEIARESGVEITFASWLLAASVPTLISMIVLPPLLYKLIGPEVQATPDAPAAARQSLAAMGPLSKNERIVLATFAAMVALWATAASLGLDSTAIAFLGFGVILASGVLTLGDIAKEGDVLATFIWFAVLFTLSGQLNELGFMGYVGQRLAEAMQALPTAITGVALVAIYVLLHYAFVSPTAHLLALFAMFLDVGVRLGVPAAPLALQLLFATNYVGALAPQGASTNLLFVGSGFASQGDFYRLGLIVTAINVLLFISIGMPWLWLVLG